MAAIKKFAATATAAAIVTAGAITAPQAMAQTDESSTDGSSVEQLSSLFELSSSEGGDKADSDAKGSSLDLSKILDLLSSDDSSSILGGDGSSLNLDDLFNASSALGIGKTMASAVGHNESAE